MTPRFRFAPSPTGAPHVGNLHTALFSWALARSLNGDFILRIEDTDSARHDPVSAEQMLAALRWLGLDWDEGPDIGGPHGPYVQSERRTRHREVAEQLLSAGVAYLDEGEAGASASGPGPLRLRLPRTGDLVIRDALRGDVRFAPGAVSDPALLRGDGTPLYHLAAMVDDHDMGITHVVRGEEWLASAPAHAYLYRVLEWPEPIWIHLPLLLNRRGEKLKKRDPEGGYLIRDFQRAGYLPVALFNYLLLLGWSPDGEQEIIDRWTLRRQFKIERLSRSASTFDWDKLNWVSRHYLQKLPDGELLEAATPFLDEAYGPLPPNPAWLTRLLRLVLPEADRLDDLLDLVGWAFEDDFEYTDAVRDVLLRPDAGLALVRLVALIARHAVLLDERTAEQVVSHLRNDLAHVRPADILQPVRAALIGDPHGPPVPSLMALLGPSRVQSRLARAIRWRSAHPSS